MPSPLAGCRNIAQHHASKMSSLMQPASLASSQSPSFTHLSWMEINAAEGPPDCSCILPVCAYACMPCLLIHSSERSLVDGYHAEGSPCSFCFTCSGLPFLCGKGLSECTVFECVNEMYPPTLSYITLLYRGVEKKKQREKKGASFSPHQLGEAMLCPCNCVGISSINSATLDNKYRVHRQLLWDLRRGCVKVCLCVCVCVCLSLCVYWKGEKKPRAGAFAPMNYLFLFIHGSRETLTCSYKMLYVGIHI